MRGLATIGLIGLCIASAALAQTEPPAPPQAATFPFQFVPPRPNRLPRSYPPNALDWGISGVAHFCCTVRDDRTLDCRPELEWPADARFGEYGQRYTGWYSLTEVSYADWQAAGRPIFQLPMQWRSGTPPRGFDEQAAQISALSTNLCGPGSVRSEPLVISVQGGARPGRF